MTNTWILVGDGSHARVFEASSESEPWHVVRKADREHSRERTDRISPHEDRGEHGFARRLATELETARQSGRFAQLVLVAPPKFLGQLRSELGAPLEACVVKSVDKDLTHLPDGDVQKHVEID